MRSPRRARGRTKNRASLASPMTWMGRFETGRPCSAFTAASASMGDV